MFILEEHQVTYCQIQIKGEDKSIKGITYGNLYFRHTESYSQQQEDQVFEDARKLLAQRKLCVILQHADHYSLWELIPEETAVVLSQADEQRSQLSSEFLNDCQRELTRYIGPMAKWVCDEVLENLSEVTCENYIEALAAEIPDATQANQFRNDLYKKR